MYASESANLLGKHHNFFASMKCKQKEEYQHLLSLDGEFIHDKYYSYINEQKIVLDALAEEYYWLEEQKLLFDFSKLIASIGLMNNEGSFIAHAGSVIFNGNETFQAYPTYLKYKKILVILLKFKQKKEGKKNE